jgi:outer membrane protein assembly factor BamD
MRRLLALFLPLALFALAGCAGSDDSLKQADQPVGNLYNDAYDQLQQKNYKKAADLFEEVERQHPYSNWATKADLMAAFSQYQGLHYDDAIADLDRFIQLHPGHPDIAYAYYLKALCYFEQINDPRRDQTDTVSSLSVFEDVVRRFPDTPYAKDAAIKIALARDRLAAQDMDVGRYYQAHGLYIAAIKRFRDVTENYQTTTDTPEALLRLVECYKALGIDAEAKRVAAVLGYNYPASQWYKDAYRLVGDTHAPKPPVDEIAHPIAIPASAPAPAPVAQPSGDDESGWFSGLFGSDDKPEPAPMPAPAPPAQTEDNSGWFSDIF